MNDYREDSIRLEAASNYLPEFRMVCPYCGGGESKEISLSVRANAGQVSWLCFRASCGIYGGGVRRLADKPPHTPKPFLGETRSLAAKEFDALREKYDLNVTQSVRYSDTTCRYLLPVKGPSGQIRGHIARAHDSTQSPKTLNFKDLDEPFLHWTNLDNKAASLVLVEDWFSAEKVGQVEGCRAVSLNGTHLSQEGLQEVIANSAGQQVHVALDRDAFVKGLRIAYSLGIATTHLVYTWRLEKDLKYVPQERIERAIRERDFDFSCRNPTQEML